MIKNSKIQFWVILLTLFLLTASGALAATGTLPVSAHKIYEPIFLKAEHEQTMIAIDRAVAAAPSSGSAKEIEDANVLLDWQKKRTPSQCAAADSEAYDLSLEKLFGVKHQLLTDAQVKRWSALMSRAKIDADYYSYRLKNKYHRQRPYVWNTKIEPCINRPEVTSFAYPSGHAAISRVMARLLSKLEPAREKQFLERADQVALNRIIGGVHHPSDIEAGKQLADAVVEALLKNEDFLKELNAVKP